MCAATRIVCRLLGGVGYTYDSVAVSHLLMRVASVASLDDVDEAPADGVDGYVVWEVGPLEQRNPLLDDTCIRYCHGLSDFVTDDMTRDRRLLSCSAVGHCRTFGVPNHDSLAGSSVAARDCRDAVDGVGQSLALS